MANTLVIETLGLTYQGNYGYQEYLFNILDYFYENRDMLKFDRIIIACREDNILVFQKYSNKFEIKSFRCSNIIIKYWILNNLCASLFLNKHDVIFFTNNYSSFFKRCIHILVIHDLLYLRKKYMPSILFRLQRRLFIPISVKLADKIIAISQWVETDIKEHFNIKDQSKTIAIYNYFNFKKYELGFVDSEIISLVGQKKFFLVVSSSSLHKNVITVFKAFLAFCNNNNEANLVYVGNIFGNLKCFYEQLHSDIKSKIMIVNTISNDSLGYLYKKTCGYISASLFEGLGMPIVEAMYFNAPVIVSDIAVIREITRNYALYFPPTDHLALCQLMEKVYSEGEKYKTQSLAIDLFSEENTVKLYIKEINNFYTSK